MSEARSLSFSVEGEFITNLAREWYYVEHKPYEKSEELLLSCMEGTEQTEEELKKLVKDIMIGKLKLEGNSNKEGLYLESDDYDIIYYIDGLQFELKKERQSKEKYKENLDKMLDDIDEGKLRYKTVIKRDSLIDSLLKASKTENNYGWLSPKGEFIPIDWGQHQEWASNYIKESEGLLKEFKNSNFSNSSGDFLVDIKGWVLLHNPSQGVAKPLYRKDGKLTRKQKDFLYEYYIDRDEKDLAILYRY